LRALGRSGLVLAGGRSLGRLIRAHDPDVVVSTYPAATSVVGALRRRGSLVVPAYATVTDLAGVAFWAHPGIDCHLVMHDSCVDPLERLAGPGSARCVLPLVHPRFFVPLDRTAARTQLGIDEQASLVLVSGGGWGVGDLAGAVRGALRVPGLRVLCL